MTNQRLALSLADFYPKPADLIASEIKVLAYIKSNSYMKLSQPEFNRAAAREHQRVEAQKNDLRLDSHLETHWPNIGCQPPTVRLGIAATVGRVGAQFTSVSYALTVLRTTGAHGGQHEVLRKFHFDVDTASPGVRPNKPLCHLQYCGKPLPSMKQASCDLTKFQQLHPWLSEPRIFFWPVALALLIDLALREFQDQKAKTFTEEPYWRGLVMEQELLLLAPFYRKCTEVIEGHSSHRTLADAFYG